MNECTRLIATYCPLHGECECSRTAANKPCYDTDRCPLHGPASSHAQNAEHAELLAEVKEFAERQGTPLEEFDAIEITRFAQLLVESAREKHPRIDPGDVAFAEMEAVADDEDG